MANSDLTKGIAIEIMMCGRSAYRVEKELNISRILILRWWRRWQEEKNFDRRKEDSNSPLAASLSTIATEVGA